MLFSSNMFPSVWQMMELFLLERKMRLEFNEIRYSSFLYKLRERDAENLEKIKIKIKMPVVF